MHETSPRSWEKEAPIQLLKTREILGDLRVRRELTMRSGLGCESFPSVVIVAI
jgi:hypothetical protein